LCKIDRRGEKFMEERKMEMENFCGLNFKPFKENDVERFAPIFKRAFDKDSQIHLGYDGGPDGYEDGEFLRKWFLGNNGGAYAVYKDNIPVGGINVFVNKEKEEGFLGNIFIDPDYEDKGIGRLCWQFIEQRFPEIKTWRTETPKFSKRNHHFYVNKCGFKVWKIENPKDWNEGQYLLEKIIR
jgi:GNAT superfamily N-acetyltransferase